MTTEVIVLVTAVAVVSFLAGVLFVYNLADERANNYHALLFAEVMAEIENELTPESRMDLLKAQKNLLEKAHDRTS